MLFLVSRTFTEVDPESAAEGVFSDDGFVFENETMTLRELIAYIRAEGFDLDDGGGWYSTGWSTVDYYTGTDRQENLHVRLVR